MVTGKEKPPKAKAKGKPKREVHLYRFDCEGTTLRDDSEVGELCDGCSGGGPLYLVSNPPDYFKDICEKLLKMEAYCLSTSCSGDIHSDSDEDEDNSEPDLKSMVDDCIGDLGAISEEEIGTLTKFGILD